MLIDAASGEIINSREVYIHDDILEELCFDRAAKKLHLSLLKGECNWKHFSIDFLHVIGFAMTSCDFWGSSPHILDFEYVEKEDATLIHRLFETKEQNDYPFCTLTDREKYMETILTFTSGDKLIVACESITIV